MIQSELFSIYKRGLLFLFLTLCIQLDAQEICGNGIDDNSDGRVDESYPADIEDYLILWLKADIGFGGGIWLDQSPHSNDATISGNPTQISNGMNFNSAIDFDGNDEVYSNLPQLAFDGTANHLVIFAVYQPDNSSTSQGIFGNQVGSGVSNVNVSNGNVSMGVGSGDISVPSFFTDDVHLLTWVVDEEDIVEGSSSRIYRNGSLITNLNYNENSAGSVNSDFYIGSSGTNASSLYLDGKVAEFLIYHRTDGNVSLNANQIQKIESYLAMKFGIELSKDYLGHQ